MFEDMVKNIPAFIKVAKALNGRKLRVATMCSGTESPLLALDLICRTLKRDHGVKLDIEHVFSCEIVPWKQAYIERNFHPPILFRDVTELGQEEATTAYGAKAVVPLNVDVLIAGTSCVDYSTLNNNKQDIEAKGESGETFRGMMGWVKRAKPEIVILENVCSAPWEKVKEYFNQSKYSATFARFDTKNYYIPHTRTRVYLFAVRQKQDWTRTEKWMKTIKSLERPASAPYDAFLLATDDPRIQLGREKLVKEEFSRQKNHEWAKCETRHTRARNDEQIGNRRPLTNWSENGTCKMHDFAWIDWAASQVDRVWDLMDISFMRGALKGYDSTYKSILWNLSQNVDRQIGSSIQGICPCLTPSMIAYLNYRGGPMLGIEALSLQGLPVDELILTRETEDNLADLAGNAMSATVVGAAMIAALTVCADLLAPEEDQANITEVTDVEMSQTGSAGLKDDKITGDDQLEEAPFDLAKTTGLSLADILERAVASARLCNCEGRAGMTTQALNRCQDCGHTTCVRCGGRPEHNYLPIDTEANPRLSPLTFGKEAKGSLPMCVEISGVTKEMLQGLRTSLGDVEIKERDWKSYCGAVVSAVSQELRFHALKRQATWIVTFDSPTAYLEFHLDPKCPEWRLFAKPPASEPANSPVRQMLEQPIARLRVKSDILEGNWEFALPVHSSFEIKISGVHQPDVEGDGLVYGWENRLGLQKEGLKNKKVWSKLKVEVPEKSKAILDRDISGIYRWLPNCAAANASLHVRENESEPVPLFFFLDPTKYGDNDVDPFVFSTSIRRYDYGESRPLIATLVPSWRQSDKDGEQQLKVSVSCKWVSTDSVTLQTAPPREARYAVPKAPLKFDVSDGGCRHAQAILTCRMKLGEDAGPVWPREKWVEVDKIHERVTFQNIAFMTERLQNIPNQGEWTSTSDNIAHFQCELCAPKTPHLQWHKGEKGRAVAIEDAEEAGVFERALKHRPSPFVTRLLLDADGVGHVRIGINVPTLTHRAITRLPSKDRTGPTLTSYRITTDYMPPAKLIRPKFKLASNRRDTPHSQPESFKLKLRPEQLRSLSWMLAREAADSPEFEEEEIAEAILEPMSWRAEAKASRFVRVRGGVLADEVGYGKTAISLGLIACADAENEWEAPPPSVTRGLIPTKATLVVVPPHLTKQWDSEVRKFTKDGTFRVKVVESVSDLNSLRVKSVQKADIVIVASNLFHSLVYLENFELLSGTGALPTTYGRYWRDRLTTGLSAIREQTKRLVKEGAEAVWDKIIEGQKKDTTLKPAVAPSKRVRGQKYRDMKEAEAAEKFSENGRSTSQSSKHVPKKNADGSSEEDDLPRRPRKAASRAKTVIVIEDSSEDDAGSKQKTSSKKVADEDDFEENDSESEASEDEEESIEASEPEESEELEVSEEEVPKKKKKVVAKKPAPAPPAKPTKKRKSEAVDVDDEKPTKKAKKSSRAESDLWKLKSKDVRADCRNMHAPSLEMFHWNRVIVDEYTYLQDKSLALITNLEASHRWVLSGTPPIHDFASVKTIAAFLGLHLGVDDEDEMPTNNRKSEKTAVEQFHSFREVRSVDWYAHRYEVGQRFLDQFVRQNIAEIDEIRSREIVKLVQLPAAERALERELDHTLRAQEMNTKRNRKTKSDRDRRIMNSLKESKSAEEALLKCVAFYDNIQSGEDNAMKACDYVVKIRNKDLEECKQDILTTIRELEKQKRDLGKQDEETHYGEWIRVTEKQGVGDHRATEIVLQLYDEAKRLGDIKKGKSKTQDEETKPKRKNATSLSDALWEHREKTHELRLLVKELLGRVRSLRYFEAVRDLQKENEVFLTDCSGGCGKTGLSKDQISLLSSCGHLGCHDCIRRCAIEEECVLKASGQCEMPAKLLNIVPGDSLGTDDEIKDASRQFGKKLEEVIDVIQNRIPKKDRVLLFIQYPDLMKKVAEALEANKVTFLQINGTAKQKSSKLETFQDPKAKEKVLLLALEDESASGANLTVANHVMFLSPMFPSSKEQYKATETQAIGRARRYGQVKEVIVWRFVAKDTIDREVYKQFAGRDYQEEGAPNVIAADTPVPILHDDVPEVEDLTLSDDESVAHPTDSSAPVSDTDGDVSMDAADVEARERLRKNGSATSLDGVSGLFAADTEVDEDIEMQPVGGA
ncbi:hypothetical protein FRC02_009614 [Tulasnella sp. 418]|nr:hypothetical protein FRC02_009614 [Tulasnella sp. 418]